MEEKLGDCVDFLCSKFDVVYEDSISIISDCTVGDVCFGYFQLYVYTVEKKMTEILSFVEENKTKMKDLGFSSIYKGDRFAWKTPFAPSNFDAKQYSGLYGDDTILNHFIVTVNTNHVREEIAAVLDDIVTKIENKDVKKQSDIRKFTPKCSQMRALKQNSVNENAVKTGEQESKTTVTEQKDETVSSALEKITDLFKLRYFFNDARYLVLLFKEQYHDKVKYDSETGEFYVFSKKWEIDHDFTCVSSFIMNGFYYHMCEDYHIIAEIYKKMKPLMIHYIHI